VERCVAGDREAQRLLFRRERGRVHAVLYRLLGSNTDMDDLVQDAFLEIFRSLHGFRGEARLATWIDRVSARVGYQYLSRRRARPPRLELVEEVADGDPSAEDRAIALQATRALYRLLDELRPEHRVAFALHVIDGRPVAEIAAVLEVTVVTIKVWIWRARRRIEKRAHDVPALRTFVADDRGAR
jgi:RNA polymerase sigma-70 factor (ECF subfamily)